MITYGGCSVSFHILLKGNDIADKHCIDTFTVYVHNLYENNMGCCFRVSKEAGQWRKLNPCLQQDYTYY